MRYPQITVPSQDDAAPDATLFNGASAIKLGVFAFISPSKGQEDAIRAVAEIARRHDVELLLAGSIGDQAYRDWLARLAEDLGISERVHFPGNLAEPYAAMRACDIVLVCSRNEAFGRVAIEASLLRRPVVYAAAGGLLETMIDRETGLAYPPGDTGRLVACLEEIIADPELGRALSESGMAQRYDAVRRRPASRRDLFGSARSPRRRRSAGGHAPPPRRRAEIARSDGRTRCRVSRARKIGGRLQFKEGQAEREESSPERFVEREGFGTPNDPSVAELACNGSASIFVRRDRELQISEKDAPPKMTHIPMRSNRTVNSSTAETAPRRGSQIHLKASISAVNLGRGSRHAHFKVRPTSPGKPSGKSMISARNV